VRWHRRSQRSLFSPSSFPHLHITAYAEREGRTFFFFPFPSFSFLLPIHSGVGRSRAGFFFPFPLLVSAQVGCHQPPFFFFPLVFFVGTRARCRWLFFFFSISSVVRMKKGAIFSSPFNKKIKKKNSPPPFSFHRRPNRCGGSKGEAVPSFPFFRLLFRPFSSCEHSAAGK